MSNSSEDEDDRTDVTANVPDHLLCQIFDRLSLPAKFKLAGVNRKFRRCILALLNDPMPLELDYVSDTLNGYKIPRFNWPRAVEVLAPHTQFTKLYIDGLTKENVIYDWSMDLWFVLRELLENDCLGQLTEFRGSENCATSCTTYYIQKTLSKCHKLSIAHLDFQVRPLEGSNQGGCRDVSTVDLNAALSSKPDLTDLKLRLFEFDRQTLIDLLEAIGSSSKLRKVDLECRFFSKSDDSTGFVPYYKSNEDNSLSVVQFFTEPNWTHLEEMHLNVCDDVIRFDDLFAAIARLPNLHTCVITTNEDRSGQLFDQFVPAVTTLLKAREDSKHLSLECGVMSSYNEYSGKPACQYMRLIGQILAIRPSLQVSFEQNCLQLVSENLSFKAGAMARQCRDLSCLRCVSCYPIVIRALDRSAKGDGGFYLQDHQLDRCKVPRVLGDLNEVVCNRGLALAAETDEAKERMNITFATRQGEKQFKVGVDCGRCINIACMGCLVI